MRRGGNRGRGTRGAVDHGHLAEELALAERDDHGLGRTAALGDLDLTVEHDIELAARGAFLENDMADVIFVDAFLDRHAAPRESGRSPRGGMLDGKSPRANDAGTGF